MRHGQQTVEMDARTVAEYVIFHALEADEIDIYVPEGVESDEVWEGIDAKNVDRVQASDEHVEVDGSFTVRRHVRTIPASGGAKGEPPINPPEAVFEEEDMYFVVHYYFEDFGHAEGVVDVA